MAYVKKTYQEGGLVTPEDMNRIETGIADNENKINILLNEFIKTVKFKNISSKNLWEITESGIYLTDSSEVQDLPTGWSQGRHLLIVFSVPNNISYSGQIIIPYRNATSTAKKMAFRICLNEGSVWQELATITKTPFSCTARTGITITDSNCYTINGQAYIWVRVKKTDGSAFAQNLNTFIVDLPFTPKKNTPLSISTIRNGNDWRAMGQAGTYTKAIGIVLDNGTYSNDCVEILVSGVVDI